MREEQFHPPHKAEPLSAGRGQPFPMDTHHARQDKTLSRIASPREGE